MKRGTFRHGMTRTPTYVVWSLMRRRCHRPASEHEKRLYMDRGVAVCDRWHDFVNFLKDMGVRPDGHQIDRIDPGGNYEPGNCRWVTPAEQARNKRSTRFIEFNGERLCLADWAKKLGVAPVTLHARLGRLRWAKERALTEQNRRTVSDKA